MVVVWFGYGLVGLIQYVWYGAVRCRLRRGTHIGVWLCVCGCDNTAAASRGTACRPPPWPLATTSDLVVVGCGCTTAAPDTLTGAQCIKCHCLTDPTNLDDVNLLQKCHVRRLTCKVYAVGSSAQFVALWLRLRSDAALFVEASSESNLSRSLPHFCNSSRNRWS